MMDKKLLVIISGCVLLGISLACFSSFAQFFYLLFLILLAFVIFALKKEKFTVMDWLLLFIASIPFHGFKIGTEFFYLRISEIIFIPFFFFWLAGKVLYPEKEIRVRPEIFMLIGFLIINILSTVKAMYPLISIKRVVIIAYLLYFCYMVSDIVKSEKRIFILMKASIIVSAATAVLAVLQVFIPVFHIFDTHSLATIKGVTLYRAAAAWEDPNYYALYLTMNSAFALSYLFSGNALKKKSLLVCLFLQLAGIVATFSRMGIICFVSMFLFLLFSYRKTKIALWFVLICMLLIAGMVYSIEYIYEEHPLAQAYLFRHPDMEMLKQYPQLILVYRWDAYVANWRMFRENPFLGVGPFMAMYNYSKYKPVGTEWKTKELFDTHNQYLQLLSEKGIFGFIFFMGFIALIWHKLTVYIRSKKNTLLMMMLIGLKGSLLVYLVGALVAQTTHELQFWFTCGLCLAAFNILENRQNEQYTE